MLEAPRAFQVSCSRCGRQGPQSRSKAAAARAWRADICGFPVTCDPMNMLEVEIPGEIPAGMAPEGAFFQIVKAEDGKVWLTGPVAAPTHVANGQARTQKSERAIPASRNGPL
jgi:hypothetical protein